MTLGDIIKKYRIEHDMSMDTFSEKSGISKAYISLLEKNKHPKTGKPIAPSIQCIKQAANGMGIDFDSLFNQIDKNNQVSLIDIGKNINIEVIDSKSNSVADRFYSRMSTYYNKLNEVGKQEACKRVEELTQIPKYIDEPVLIAAHHDNPTDEQIELIKEDIKSLKKPEN